MYKTVGTYVDVDVDLDDFDDDDLIEHLQSKGYRVEDTEVPALISHQYGDGLLSKIYELRCMNKPYERELEQLLWLTIGRM